MADMIERVARAIDDDAGTHSEDVSCWYDHARAAIKAMREPTEAMLEIVVSEPVHLYAIRDDDYQKRMQVAVKVDRLVALQRHRAMIDAALASERKP